VFAPNNAATRGLAQSHVEEALLLWEPRITVLDVTARPGGEQGEVININVEYLVRTTDNRFNLVYPFYLDRGAV
jgi:phage baseplate assembly protein W